MTPADAAWDALYVSILHAEGDGQSIERRMKRHRPLIEAALTPPPAEPTLDVSVRDIIAAERELAVEPEDNGWQERGQPDDDYANWSGATTFAMVLQKTGWRVELFWNGSGGWFTARLISPWDRDGNATYPGGFLAPFDNPLGASGATPEEAFAHLAEAVLEWA